MYYYFFFDRINLVRYHYFGE